MAQTEARRRRRPLAIDKQAIARMEKRLLEEMKERLYQSAIDPTGSPDAQKGLYDDAWVGLQKLKKYLCPPDPEQSNE